jgi:hypothetical protein
MNNLQLNKPSLKMCGGAAAKVIVFIDRVTRQFLVGKMYFNINYSGTILNGFHNA